MNRLLHNKFVIILVVIVMFIAIDGLVQNVSIVDRGIVIGLAIDYDNDNLVVTTQMILPKNGGVSSGGNNHAIYSASGKTIREALDSIGRKAGSHVSLAHTTVVMLNTQLITRGEINIIEYFITNNEISDTCLLAATEAPAKDILSANVPFGEVASYQLERVLRPSRQTIGNCPITLKNFFVRYYAREPSMYLPLIHTEASPPSTDQAQQGVTDTVVLRSNKTAIFNKNCCMGEITGDANNALSLLLNPISSGTITISGRDGNPSAVNILDSSVSKEYDMDKQLITINVTLNTLRDAGVHLADGSVDFSLNEEEQEHLKTKVSAGISDLFTTAQQENIDILMAYNNMYRHYADAWLDSAQEDYLQHLSVNVNVTISQR